MHAEGCPICGGRGTIEGEYDYYSTLEKICHGCNGKGWVEVRDNEVEGGEQMNGTYFDYKEGFDTPGYNQGG